MTKIWVTAVAVLWFAGDVVAGTITGGVDTNLCGNTVSSSTLGPLSGTCSSALSTFTYLGDAEGSGLTWGDQISLTDSNVDANAYGDYARSYTRYTDLVTLSQTSDVTLYFNVDGSTSNVNGNYALYYILPVFTDQNGNTQGQFLSPNNTSYGTGSGTATFTLQEGVLTAGTYDLVITTYAEVALNTSNAGQTESVSADFLDTFQLTGVTTTNGATLIGADGTNFTDLSAAPEPGSLELAGAAAFAMLAAKLLLLSIRRSAAARQRVCRLTFNSSAT